MRSLVLPMKTQRRGRCKSSIQRKISSKSLNWQNKFKVSQNEKNFSHLYAFCGVKFDSRRENAKFKDNPKEH